MLGRAALARVSRVANVGVVALLRSPALGPRLGRRMTVISYLGRRSGRAVSTPVEYRRDGDVVRIGVILPDAKTWWRNFLDDGHPISLQLPEGERTGRGVARRDAAGKVTVTVTLHPLP